MTTIDDIRIELAARVEAAESELATIEIRKAQAADLLHVSRAALDAHDRAVVALLERHPVATAAPLTESVKQKPRKLRSRAPRLFGRALDERREKIVAAYKRGTPTEKLALMHQVSKVRIQQSLKEHEEKTGEKIERHWQTRARIQLAEPGEDAPPMAAAER